MRKRGRVPFLIGAAKKGTRPLFFLLSLRAVFALTTAPAVYSAEVDSIIHPASAQYMIEAMDRADAGNCLLYTSDAADE